MPEPADSVPREPRNQLLPGAEKLLKYFPEGQLLPIFEIEKTIASPYRFAFPPKD
jgi:hypothetical protein